MFFFLFLIFFLRFLPLLLLSVHPTLIIFSQWRKQTIMCTFSPVDFIIWQLHRLSSILPTQSLDFSVLLLSSFMDFWESGYLSQTQKIEILPFWKFICRHLLSFFLKTYKHPFSGGTHNPWIFCTNSLCHLSCFWMDVWLVYLIPL